MTVAAGQNRRAHRIRRTGVGSPENPTPDAPTAPSPVTAATPASLIIGWGGFQHAITNMASYTTWRSWGFDGHAGRMSNNYLYNYGNSYQSKGSSAAGESDSSWNYQKAYQGLAVPALNGGATGLGVFKAKEAGIISWAGLNTKLAQNNYTTTWGGASTTPAPSGYSQVTAVSQGPPFGSWADDTVWADVCTKIGTRAAMVNFLGGDGLVFDPEDNGKCAWRSGLGWWKDSSTKVIDYGRPLGNISVTAQAALQEQRGYEFFTAIYDNFQDCDVIIYQLEGIENSWPVKVGIDRIGRLAYQELPMPHVQFFLGGLRAHADAGSTGKFVVADAWWYRYVHQYSGSNQAIAQKWDTQGPLAAWSRTMSTATRNQAMPYLFFTPMHWAGTDGTTNYDNSQETDPTWTNSQEQHRRRGMGGLRVEYTLEGAPNICNAGLWTASNNYQGSAGRTTAFFNTGSTTDNYSNVAPTVSAGSSGSGSTRTISGTASHPLGIHYIKCQLWRAGSNTGTAQIASMTWDLGGGSVTTNIDNAFMNWTATMTGVASGDYVIVTAYSIQNQQKSTVVGPL